MRGGYFQLFTKNQPQKHQKRATLHTSQANGGGSSPPPGYATVYKVEKRRAVDSLTRSPKSVVAVPDLDNLLANIQN